MKEMTPVLQCMSSHISEGWHIEAVVITHIIVSSMHSNGQNPEQTALDYYINP